MEKSRAAPKITWVTWLFYSFGSVAYGVKDQGFAFLLAFYYNQVLGMPAKLAGFALLIVLVIDACVDPLIGHWSDNFRSRWGRRHPFMYATALPVAFLYVLLWLPPSGLSTTGLFFYLVGVAALVRCFASLYEIPSSALAPEFAAHYDGRTWLLGLRQLFGWLGGLGIGILGFGLFFRSTETYKFGQLNPAAYTPYAWTAAIIIASAILISALGTHRYIPYLQAPPPRRKQAFGAAIGTIIETLSHRSLLMLLGAGLFSGTAIGVTTVLTTYFQTDYWELTGPQIAVLLLANVISAAIAVPSAGVLGRVYGKKRAAIGLWALSILVSPLPLLLRQAGWFPDNGTPLLFGLLFIHSAINVALFISTVILVTSMISDIVEDRQVATGRRSEGLFFAVNFFIAKFTSGIGVFAAGIIISGIGLPEHAQPGQIAPSILANLVWIDVPLRAVLFVIAMMFVSAYRIDRQTHEANLARLRAEGGQPVLRAAE
jgi:glycoside/pentoside/hexuronide:cation symporter, GPH family